MVHAVKILATADLHGKFDGIDVTSVDMLLLAGDVARQKPSLDDIKSAARQIEQWARAVPVVYVRGNHDTYHRHGVKVRLEDEVLKSTDGRFFCLDKGLPTVNIFGVKIAGIPWFQGKGSDAEKIAGREKHYRDYHDEHLANSVPCDILMVHCPPADVGIDDPDAMQAIAEIVAKMNPQCVICGHSHGRAGVYGDEKNIFCVSQRAALLDEKLKLVSINALSL